MRILLPSLLSILALSGCGTPDNAPIFGMGDQSEQELAASMADSYLQSEAGLLGMSEHTSFAIQRIGIDELSMAHVHVQQEQDGVPVFGAEAIVHFDPWGELSSVNSTLLPDVQVDTIPSYAAEEAKEAAIFQTGGWEKIVEEPIVDLWILRHNGKDHLVWRVQVDQLEGVDQPARPVLFIDAHSLEVIWSYDNLQTGTGTAYVSGNVSINTYQKTGTYYLEDTTHKLGTYTYGNGTSRISYVTDADDVWTADTVAVQAHYNAALVWDYYQITFGRNGIDGAGGPSDQSSLTGVGKVLSSRVHYSRNYVNAYWSGSYMVYGDGDGVSANALVSVDIAGHEMTHGVTQYTSNLVYSGESGGLNEASSDILGSMVERYADGSVTSSDTWKVGEDVWTPGVAGDALRYMNNPASDGYSADYYSSATGNLDVHYSSGVANLAFYLMSEGGAHPTRGGTAMTGIGADKAAQIWYRALTTYMTSSTGFSGARTATLSAASDLYGATSTEYTAVGDAWTMVGVAASSGGSTCSGYTYSNSNSLAGTGSYAYEPGNSYYTSNSSGVHSASLAVPTGTNFDIYLQKYSKNKWSTVATSATANATETISYNGTSGNYRWQVKSSSGGGSYTLCNSHP